MRSPSDERPDFLVTTHSYALPSWNSPEIIALNLVTDMVFSKSRYGMMKGNDLGDGRMFSRDIRAGT
uniref:Uncharacterized protein n=1 Tax=Zea mays TaxID=4577 RepID=B6TSD8_MAIZE|nr:hypothetical protein [Zea mays]